MDQADRDAIVILREKYYQRWADDLPDGVTRDFGCHRLVAAIAHLAYPDRAIYPKTRRATKRHPVELNYGRRTDPR